MTRPTLALVLDAMARIGRPASADRILEQLLTDHWQVPAAVDWTAKHVADALKADDSRHTRRVGVTREGPSARLQGRPVPLYALAPPSQPWQVTALERAARRCGGELGAEVSRVLDWMRSQGVV